GNLDNVAEIRRRHSTLRVEHVDLEKDTSLEKLGTFDIVYCYGLLYHLANPERAIAQLAKVCRGQILLETCVSLGKHSEVIFLRDFVSNNQAVSGIGCRPSRLWLKEALERYFGHAYFAKTQPAHPDFPTDWDCPLTNLLYRGIFVGSRAPLENPHLTRDIPRQQLALSSAG
ncbi:MAG: class I SAM-dependent methyltransferase, partial [Gammaproteobacteria bacterium]|nr:class I SAM-dependent methyltransferase [Gammaproteobacteria bacterium]